MIFCTQNKAYINHTDAGGIVYHANYFSFFENCRRDYLKHLGFDYFIYDDDTPIHFVIKSASIDYLAPIFLDDEFMTIIDDIILKPASLVFCQSIIKDGKICATTQITLACVKNHSTHNKKLIVPCRIPQTLSDKIALDIKP